MKALEELKPVYLSQDDLGSLRHILDACRENKRTDYRVLMGDAHHLESLGHQEGDHKVQQGYWEDAIRQRELALDAFNEAAEITRLLDILEDE